MKTNSHRATATAILLTAAACMAHADTFYNNQATWASSVTGATTINFEGIVPTNGYQAYAGSTTVGGVTFGIGPASPSGLLFVIGDNFYGFGVASVSSQDPGTGINPTNDLLITLPSPVTALAFHFIVDPGPVSIALSDGSSQSVTETSTPTFDFFGVTGSTGITSLDITEPYSGSSQSINVSDFSFAGAAPEPGTFLLFGTALAGLAAVVRRRRQVH